MAPAHQIDVVSAHGLGCSIIPASRSGIAGSPRPWWLISQFGQKTQHRLHPTPDLLQGPARLLAVVPFLPQQLGGLALVAMGLEDR